MLKTFVKVGGINNLSDARYCAGMGVDQLGFTLTETEDEEGINEKAFNDICGWVSGIEVVLENYSPDMHNHLEIEWVEARSAEEVNIALQNNKKVIRIIGKSDLTDIDSCKSDQIDYYLIKVSLEDVMKSQKEIKDLSSIYKVVLELNQKPNQNISELLEKFNLGGISLHGGSEIRPGLKDYDTLSEILEELEEE